MFHTNKYESVLLCLYETYSISCSIIAFPLYFVFLSSEVFKDVLIALRDKWSNDPSIYNPHEAPTLLSLMLLKEISEWYVCVCIDSSHQTLINLVLDGQIINYLSKFATCFNHWRQTWFSTHRWHCICAVFLCFNLFHIPPLQ